VRITEIAVDGQKFTAPGFPRKKERQKRKRKPAEIEEDRQSRVKTSKAAGKKTAARKTAAPKKAAPKKQKVAPASRRCPRDLARRMRADSYWKQDWKL